MPSAAPATGAAQEFSMQQLVEMSMYQLGQIFLFPTLALVSLLFLYAFWLLGHFALQAWQRRNGGGRPLLARFREAPNLNGDELDVYAHTLLEAPRIASRVTPMLGLVATMIPMGPALKSLSDGNLAQVSENLMVAFSAVILALIAASITYWIVNVRRRWLAEELLEVEALRQRAGGVA
jgi:biopolymer transport protein ExbB/TolQ